MFWIVIMQRERPVALEPRRFLSKVLPAFITPMNCSLDPTLYMQYNLELLETFFKCFPMVAWQRSLHDFSDSTVDTVG